MRTLATLLAICTLSTTASAVPLTLHHQGRLMDSATGLPVDGNHDLRFSIFDTASGGTALWTETHSTAFSDGYFASDLGSVDALDSSLFQNSDLWLEIQVGLNAPIPDRIHLHSVPFAIRAGSADTATSVSGGVVDASEIRVNGSTVIDGSGSLATDVDWTDVTNTPEVLGELTGCGAGEVPTYDGIGWGCSPLPDVTSIDTGALNGVIDIANLPIGGGSNEVSAGDHSHTPPDIVGVLSTTQLPIGTGSGNVAAGDHGHTAADVGALPAGTTAADIGALPASTTAADIGALPATTTAADIGGLPATTTAADIGALPVGTTAADIGAAPASTTGGVVVGDDTGSCASSGEYGTLRWNSSANKLQVCTDAGWYDLSNPAPDGSSAARAAASCNQLHADYPLAPDGVYYVNPTGSSAYQVVCNMTDMGGGWTLLLKANGNTYHYGWAGWTNGSTDNATNPDTSWSNAKYPSFNDMPISQLMLQSQLGNSSRLSLPSAATLRSYMNASTTLLVHEEGSANANHLVHGGSPSQICGTPFRINSFAYSDFRIRLGGHFVHQWSCGYGTDSSGQPCGAEAAGFGIWDQRWSPFSNAQRGFGIRQAHDYTNYAGGNGQLSTGGMIWGR